MLSWTLILLVKHPHCLQKLRHELEEKLGECRITKGNIDDLSYLTACIREAVRLYPGAYAHNVKLREEAIAEDSTGLGKEQYLVKRSDTIRLNLLAIHRDPLVYGADAEEFKPERMMEENFRKLPRNSWKVRFLHASPSLSQLLTFSLSLLAIWKRWQDLHRKVFCAAGGLRCSPDIAAEV